MKIYIEALLLIIFSFMIVYFTMNINYEMKMEQVDRIVNTYTKTVAKKGRFHPIIKEEMMKALEQYGDFEIYSVAKQYDGNVVTAQIENDDLWGVNLRQVDMDIIKITVRNLKEEPVQFFYERNWFGIKTKEVDIRVTGSSTAPIL